MWVKLSMTREVTLTLLLTLLGQNLYKSTNTDKVGQALDGA
jgi:hypothetical protein